MNRTFEDMIHTMHEDATVEELVTDTESDAIDSTLNPTQLEKLAKDEDDAISNSKRVTHVEDEMEELDHLEGEYDAEELENVDDGLPSEIDQIIQSSEDLDSDSPLSKALDSMAGDEEYSHGDDEELIASVDEEIAGVDALLNDMEEEGV